MTPRNGQARTEEQPQKSMGGGIRPWVQAEAREKVMRV